MQKVMQTNVMGMAATFHPFLEAMKAQAANPTSPQKAGTLVGIASVAGIRGMPGHAAYCASKAAAIMVTRLGTADVIPTLAEVDAFES